MRSDIDFLVVEQHAIDRLDSVFGSLGSLVMDEPVTFRKPVLVRSDFAR